MAVDTLINNAVARVNSYSSATDFLVTELRGFISDKKSGLYIPGKVNDDGTVDTGLDLTKVALPTYTEPAKDTTPFPNYEAPTSPLPTKPTLLEASSITLPQDRTEPTLNTSGLFGQTAPSTVLPEFNEAEPDLGLDALVAEMSALAKPVLESVEFPELAALNIGPAPTLTIPDYDAPLPPDTLADPENYADKMAITYDQMLPEMQAFIDDKVAVWIGQYAPEYDEWSGILQTKVTQGMSNTVLPDEIESAMFTRARGRVEQEFISAERDLSESYERSGFIQPPGALKTGIRHIRMKSAEALANQATDIYIERRKMEVQHLQYVMNLASSHVMGVRNLAISYAGVVANTMQQSAAYASELTDKLTRMYDHLIARSDLAIQVMRALNEQYEVKLKAALSALEGFKLELDAEKAKKDVEIAQVQIIEAKLRAQETEVKRYSALVDAVTRKAGIEELKLKGYETRADIFKTNTQAKVASFDVYKASIDGDKAKLEGELSKLRVFESQIKADELKLDAQIKELAANEAVNNNKVKLYQAEGDVYKLEAEAALQKFTAYAEVKKLAQSLYGQELANAIESFKANLEIPKILMEALIKEYELRVQTAIEEAKFDLTKLQIAERASEQAVGAYQAMASSALGALNTMVSQVLEEAA